MNLTNHSTSVRLCAAGLFLAALAYPALAGFKTRSLDTNGVGVVEAWLAYGLVTNGAVSPRASSPNAGVTDKGVWMTKVPQPAGTPLVCTSTVSVLRLTGGYKAVGRARVTTGVTADNDELSEALNLRGFKLEPSFCGAAYDLASGEEIIDGIRYLIVLGTATEGTAAWFRGYSYEGPLEPTAENVLRDGTKLYDVLVKGPVDFGDPNSADRCKAMKVPIPYNGPNLYLFADGIAESASDLAIVGCPESPVPLECGAGLQNPGISAVGGCYSSGSTPVLTFEPPLGTVLPFGSTTVKVTVVDSAQNEDSCFFEVVVADTTRPTIVCPEDIIVPANASCQAVVANLGNPVVWDNCGTPQVVNNAPAGNIFNLGSTVVTWTVTDGSGLKSTCTQTVNVVDETPPIPTLSSLPDAISDCTGLPVTLTAPTASDNCSSSLITGTTETPGPYNQSQVVTWKYVDGAGNSTTQQQKVVVNPLVFNGFDSPVGGNGGSCSTPLRNSKVKVGQVIPIKFDVLCNGVPLVGMTPRCRISSCGDASGTLVEGNFQLSGSRFNFPWDTSGLTVGAVYRIVAQLPNGVILGEAYVKMER